MGYTAFMIGLNAFVDELEKIAISMEDLRRVSRLAKKKTIKVPGIGPSAMPTRSVKEQLGEIQKIKDHSLKRFGEVLPDQAKRLGDQEKTLKQLSGRVLMPKGEAWQDFAASAVGKPGAKGFEAEIMMSANPRTRAARDALLKDPKGREAAEGIIKGHELQELVKGSRRPMARGTSHAQGVIPVEHNMVTTLPPEASRAGEFMKAIRNEWGGREAQAFNKATGGRIAFGEGQRLSRHAVKRISEIMERQVLTGWH